MVILPEFRNITHQFQQIKKIIKMKAKSFLYGIVCACLLLGYLNAAASRRKNKINRNSYRQIYRRKNSGSYDIYSDLKTGSITDNKRRIQN